MSLDGAITNLASWAGNTMMPTMAGLFFAGAVYRYSKGGPFEQFLYGGFASLMCSGMLRALEGFVQHTGATNADVFWMATMSLANWTANVSRDCFEEILGAMARAGLLGFEDAVFEKEGKQIPYRTVSLTPAGGATDEATSVEFVMKEAARPALKRKPLKKSRKSKGSSTTASRSKSEKPETAAAVSGSEQNRIEQALRAWRLSEAKRRRVPAFRIFGDRALLSIATTAPSNEAELLAVQGIGVGIVKKYGAHIFRVLAGSR